MPWIVYRSKSSGKPAVAHESSLPRGAEPLLRGKRFHTPEAAAQAAADLAEEEEVLLAFDARQLDLFPEEGR